MEKQRLSYLLTRYAAGTLSDAEREELGKIVLGPATDMEFEEQLLSIIETSAEEAVFNKEEWAPAIDGILATDKFQSKPIPVKPILVARKYWAAAAVLLLLGTGTYLWFNAQQTKEVTPPVMAAGTDIPAGVEGAILTLADGRRIVLDSLPNGEIASQNGARLLLKNGLLSYDASGNTSSALIYNTMSTPRGRQFQLMLPDGSKVWLNAGSSVRYPAVFTGPERNVEVEGEAYFEVVPQKNKPFRVTINKQASVEVLGTAFNINAYPNEPAVYTTLINGSVRVNDGSGASTLLKPAQRAGFSQSPGDFPIKLTTLDEAGISRITAWKNGYFNFEGMSFPEVMRQLERWYDIDISYENGVPNISFWGKMERSLSLEALLQLLKGSRLDFRREGSRKLVIINTISNNH